MSDFFRLFEEYTKPEGCLEVDLARCTIIANLLAIMSPALGATQKRVVA